MSPRFPALDQIGGIPPRTPEHDRAAVDTVTRHALDDADRALLLTMLDLQEAP